MACKTSSVLGAATQQVAIPSRLPQTQSDWQTFTQQLNTLFSQLSTTASRPAATSVPVQYATLFSSTLPPLQTTSCTVTADNSWSLFGGYSYKIAVTGPNASVVFGASGFPLPIPPNENWLLSVYGKSSGASQSFKIGLQTASNTYENTVITDATATTVDRFAIPLNLVADDASQCTLRIDFPSANGETFWFDGFQYEPSVTGSVNPSPFMSTNIIAGSIVAQFITVSQLSALSANMGTLTAGKIESADGRFTVDCSNELITITDGTNTRMQIGQISTGVYDIKIWNGSGTLLFDAATGLQYAGNSSQVQATLASTAGSDGSYLNTSQIFNRHLSGANLNGLADGTTSLAIGTGNGSTTAFALPSGWQAGAAVYKSDWQGNQLQYPTPRTNYLAPSNAIGTAPWNMFGNLTSVTPVVVNGRTLNQLNSSGGTFVNTQLVLSTNLNNGGYLTFYAIAAAGTSTQTAIRVDDNTINNHATWPINWSGGLPSISAPVVVGNLIATDYSMTNLGGGLFEISLTVQNQTGAAITPYCSLYENWTTGVPGTAEYAIWGDAQVEFAQVAGGYIAANTSTPVTVTDYTLSSTQITFASAPANAATLTALVGRSAVANGPGLQGVLSVDPYSRALIDTAQSGHLNNWQHSFMSNQTLAAIGTNPDTNGNYIQGFSTSIGIDDAGWSTEAVFGNVSQTPTTLLGYGITNGQPALGNASGEQILYQNSGAGAFWGNKYGTEFNSASTGAQSNITGITNTADAVLGDYLQIPNPGQQISIFGWVSGFTQQTAGTAGAFIQYHIEISTDGGVSYTSGNLVNATSTSLTDYIPAYAALFLPNVSPTGDVLIRTRGHVSAGTFSFGQPNLCAMILPESNFAIIGPALAITVPGTQTASCTATYPATTCAALSSITAVATGGKPAYSFSWSRTGGTGAGTIISGATSATVNVSGTETGTTGGAAFTDTYKCVVTDSLSATANGSCTVTSTYYLAYAPISPSISVRNGGCAKTGSGTCTASAAFSITATGGNGSYTYSNSVHSYQSGFTTNPTITTGATAASGTYSGGASVANPAQELTVTLQTSVNDTRGTGAESSQGTGTLSFNLI